MPRISSAKHACGYRTVAALDWPEQASGTSFGRASILRAMFGLEEAAVGRDRPEARRIVRTGLPGIHLAWLWP